MAESWVRLWADMTTDPKWQTIARKSGKPRYLVIALFAHLMLEANAAEDRGSVDAVVVEDVASALDCDEADVMAIMDAMQGRVIVDGRLAGWERRQPKREDVGNPTTGAKSSTERSREHRKRKRDAAHGNACNDVATQGNAPEAEAEAEERTGGAKAAASTPATAQPEAGDLPPLGPPAADPPADPPPDSPRRDPIQARAVEITHLLRAKGCALQPSDPRVQAWANAGRSDAELLTALEIAERRRADAGNPQPVNAGYLDSILAGGAPRSRDSPGRRQTRAERRADWDEKMNAVIAAHAGQPRREIDMGTIDASSATR